MRNSVYTYAVAAVLLVVVLAVGAGMSRAQDDEVVLLVEVEGSPALTDLNADIIATSPDGRFVFVANDSTVTAYESTHSGLEEVSGSPFYVAGNDFRPAAMVVSPDGRYLYVAHAGFVGRSLLAPVSGFLIQQGTGALIELRGSPFTTYAASGRGLSALAITPDGRHLYAVNTDNKTINIFAVNPRTGNLIDRDIVAVGGVTYAPIDIAIRPDGRYLYVANQGFIDDSDNESPINIYRIDSRTGGLRETFTSPIAVPTEGGKGLSALEMHPSGDFLFALNETNKSVSVIRLDTLGGVEAALLYAINGDDFNPRDVSVSPDGTLVFISNYGFVPMTLQSPITVLVFDAGDLFFTDEYHVPVVAQGDGLGQLAVSANGRHLFVANPGLGGLHMFEIGETLFAARTTAPRAPTPSQSAIAERGIQLLRAVFG